ncbi:MAG: TIM barrel protein [Melioribacteraceae bacterium]|nr:TIM barrel protein [Melioribacteraceae bacterium]
MVINRRDFIKYLGISAAAVALPDPQLSAFNSYKAKIGLQLYTIRRAVESDFEASVNKVAHMGYLGVETYTLPERITLKHAADVFKKAGLTVFSMHSELPVGKHRDLAVKMSEIYECDTIVYHGWPEDDKYKNKDERERTVDLYNEINNFLHSRGIKFGLHNHWWEFENKYGNYPFYYLLEHLEKSIFFEIDTYWAAVAGLNPAKIISDFGTRVPLVHIKDGPAIKGEKSYEQVPAGQGVVDFSEVVKESGSKIKWMIVEFDEYAGEIFKGIKESYNYLISNNFAEGKF